MAIAEIPGRADLLRPWLNCGIIFLGDRFGAGCNKGNNEASFGTLLVSENKIGV